MSVTLTILGSGSSAGVPRPALGWGACDPNNPKNRRRRCSLLIEKSSDAGLTRVLIDTSPDLREQLIDAKLPGVDTELHQQCNDLSRGTFNSDRIGLTRQTIRQKLDVAAQSACLKRGHQARWSGSEHSQALRHARPFGRSGNNGRR